ncbi:reverse transcriptase domain-containing protein [Tanacetum coccineum]
MTKLLEKDLVFNFDEECNKAFETLKEQLTNAPIMVSPNWSLPFELMCDASDFAVGAVLGQQDVFTVQKLKRFYRSVIMDPLRDIMDHQLPQRNFLMLYSIGQPYSKKHRLWYKTVTPANVLFEYILVAIDYVSKWAEAEALPTNDARVVVNFLKKLFSHFGIPKALISYRGTHFCNRQMEKIFKKYGVHHRIATTYHPQTSGQVENTNRALKRILEKTLHELDELRLQAYENSKLYKARTKAYHDKKLRVRKEFKAGDKVLLYNSKYKFKAPKLRSKWYGPFIVKHSYPSGYVELYDKHGGSFIVNGHRVKLYHDEEQLNELVVEEIHLMCEDRRMKAIPFMAPFPANYRETMPWASEKPYIYSVVENTCNEAKLYDLDKTRKGIILAGNDGLGITSTAAHA